MSQMNPWGASRPLDYSSDGASDVAVRNFFNTVYAWMAAGLALTGVVAWYVSQNVQVLRSMGAGIWLLFLVEIGLVFAISGAINKISAGVATGLFMLYAGINGVLLSGILLMYAHATVGAAFLVTAGAFAATSLYGFVTKADLSRWGSILFMALIGLILASIVNFFMASNALMWLINYAGVAIFVGLTAYDTQKLKQIAWQTSGNPALANRLAIIGSLRLYLDFINLFIFLVQILGNNSGRRR
jgi:uncharacterized protein